MAKLLSRWLSRRRATDNDRLAFECYLKAGVPRSQLEASRSVFARYGAEIVIGGRGSYEAGQMVRGTGPRDAVEKLIREWARGKLLDDVVSAFIPLCPSTPDYEASGSRFQEATAVIMLRGSLKLYRQLLRCLDAKAINIVQQASNMISPDFETVNATLVLSGRCEHLFEFKRLAVNGWMTSLLDVRMQVHMDTLLTEPELPEAILIYGNDDRPGVFEELMEQVSGYAHVRQSDGRRGKCPDGVEADWLIVLRLIPNEGVDLQTVYAKIDVWCKSHDCYFMVGEWHDADPPDEPYRV